MFTHKLLCVFHILYLSYTFLFYLLSILFVYYTLYFPYTVFIYCSYTIFIYQYSCIVHILFMYCTFHILSSCTFSSCSYNFLYFHRIAVLCFSYHVFYTCYFLLDFMSAYTLEVDMGITVCTRRYYHCTRQ